jgi:hypothetical protein
VPFVQDLPKVSKSVKIQREKRSPKRVQVVRAVFSGVMGRGTFFRTQGQPL